jgi:pimeloyl-ACP methyl ester carboxylesterase
MNDLQWTHQGHDHGKALAHDLGFTPIYLYYNSGQHISTNGRAFAKQLDALVRLWQVPVEELVILSHSMGGLVTRSACRSAAEEGQTWLETLRKLVFLGTPHHGSPLERGGNWFQSVLGFSAYSAPFARLGKIRSAGITDMRFGSLSDEDWENRDRFALSHDHRQPVPLPEGVQCYTVGAVLGSKTPKTVSALIGDGLVPLKSALGDHINPRLGLDFPDAHRWIGHQMNHMDLLRRKEVYERIRQWLSDN